MAGPLDDCLDKRSHGLLVEHIQALDMYLLVSKFFEGVLMVSGHKDRCASLGKCCSHSAADGPCSVHHGCLISENMLHISDSFRSRSLDDHISGDHSPTCVTDRGSIVTPDPNPVN